MLPLAVVIVVISLLSYIYFILFTMMSEATEPGRSNVNAGTMLSVLNHDAGFDAPSFVRQAIAWCKTAGTLPEAEEETLYSRLVNMRIERRHKMHASKEKNDLVEFYQVLNHKLGAYLYASKVGVQSPRIKYCGKAQDLPEDMSSQFGDKFVVKPLIGSSSKGVNIVVDGVDKFHGKSVNRDSLVKDFGHCRGVNRERPPAVQGRRATGLQVPRVRGAAGGDEDDRQEQGTSWHDMPEQLRRFGG